MITVTLKKGKGGNWSAKCHADDHRELATTSEGVKDKMRTHFRSKHSKETPYFTA